MVDEFNHSFCPSPQNINSPVIRRAKTFANISSLNKHKSAGPNSRGNFVGNTPLTISRFSNDDDFTDCFTPQKE